MRTKNMNKSLVAVFVFASLLATASAIESTPVAAWLKLPESREQLGNMHGDVAVSSNGDVYVSLLETNSGLQVFSSDGKFLRNVSGAPNDFHGFVVRKDKDGEFIYGSRLSAGNVLKMTLDGKVVL